MRKRGKLFTKLVPLIILIILIPLILQAVISINKSTKVLKENLNLTNIQLLNQVNEAFTNEISIITQQLASVGKNTNLNNLSNSEIEHSTTISSVQEMFINVRDTLEGTVNVYYAGEYGEIVGCTKVKSIHDFNYTERKWYIEAKNKNGQPVFTEPEQDKETGKQVMTIAQAVKDNQGNFLGVLALDINLDKMENYIKNIKMSNTGYAMIVNVDGKIIVNNNNNKDGESFEQLPFWNSFKDAEQSSYEWEKDQDVLHVSQITNNETGWKIIGFVNEKEIQGNVDGIKLTMIFSIVVCILLGSLAGIMMTIYIVKQLNKINVCIAKVAKGDLTEQIHVTSNNEFGEAGNNFNTMVENISSLISNVEKTSTDIFESTVNISNMSQETTVSISEVTNAISEVSKGATNQAQASQTANESVEKLNLKIEEIDKNTDKINNLSSYTEKLTKEGLEILEDLIIKSIKTKNNSTESNNIVKEMAKKIENINYISTAIAGITEQTNLLSLNASIEAARAGEAGKGFAVVAEEIRKLSEQSKESTDKIKEMVTEIGTNSILAYKAMEENSIMIEEQDDAVERTKDIFNKIVNSIIPLTDTIKVIKKIENEMNKEKNNVQLQVENIAAVSQETASVSEEVTASAEEVTATMDELTQYTQNIKNIANKLKDEIEKFNL